MDRLLRDVRQSLRSLAASRGFTAATVVLLALGIGASTAIFSVAEHVLFRPLPLPHTNRIVTICETHPGMGPYCAVSPPDAEDWAARARTLDAVGVARASAFTLRGLGGHAMSLTGGIATPGFFSALGVQPLRGRLIEPGDLPPRGSGRVVVLSYGLWQGRMGGDPGVLGRTIQLDGEPYTIVGILPEHTYVPRLDYVDLWAPLPFDPRDESNRSWRGFVAAARLTPGSTPAAAAAELGAIDAGLAAVHPDALKGWGVSVQRMQDYLVRGSRPALLLFLAAAALVLLIVCVNVAGLMLIRATAREREVSIRLALGGTRAAIVQRLLTESVILGLLGGAAGALIAVWATDTFVHLAPAGMPRIDEVAVDGPVLAFAAVISLLSGLAAGLMPALRSARADMVAAMSEGRTFSAGRSAGRTRRSLVVGQMAMALMLVVAAALLMRSFAGLLDWQPGFPTRGLLTFQVFPSTGRYQTQAEVLGLYRQAETELRHLPGVEGASTMSAGPIFGGDGGTPFLVAGRDVSMEDAPSATWFDVGPDYFRVLGLPIVQGRGLTEEDRPGMPVVAVVNQTMARRFWPGRSPVGARLLLPRVDSLDVRIVGVVKDMAPFFRGQAVEPQIYWSNRQRTRWATYFVLRTAGDPMKLAGPATAVLQRLDPDLEPAHMRTMEQAAAALRGRPRFDLTLVAVFALVALILGVVGVYGVTAYAVRSRAHEIGIRMALGGGPRELLLWVMAGGARMLAWGLALGLLGALLVSRLLAGLLYGVRPTDPTALSASAILLLLAGLAATLLPAWRASRTDPADALRQE